MPIQNKVGIYYLNMEVGTHNSMTYLKPKRWYLYPFRFIAKCQSLTIQEQYNLGIRLFDIRISYDKDNNPEFRHGSMAFKGDVYKTLEWLNSQGCPIKIRILLEEKKESTLRETLFIKDINKFKSIFLNLTFYEGRRKFDWKQIIELPTLDIIQLVSSMDNNIINDIWPWLYAKLHNKKHIKQYSDYYKYNTKPILLDFVDGTINCTNI